MIITSKKQSRANRTHISRTIVNIIMTCMYRRVTDIQMPFFIKIACIRLPIHRRVLSAWFTAVCRRLDQWHLKDSILVFSVWCEHPKNITLGIIMWAVVLKNVYYLDNKVPAIILHTICLNKQPLTDVIRLYLVRILCITVNDNISGLTPYRRTLSY